ncbi:putative tetratricopeptide-like helical domain-containing protein [Rosa chinensis]|uniref:Putative tetratricopeptide-like helical domain-containing protein n=1 Tax=Rosa chinensis TaxID=74649 RepID=A0A2P6SNS8_ROSCH|nr:putative tetratricopeptide-like helical domain-containing protein [Rosa chinensis]
MLVLKTLKQTQWKQNLKRFSTLYKPPKTDLPAIVSTNISITSHCKTGQLDIARKLFDEMPHRTVVSWNAMISGYSKWGRFGDALFLVSAMHRGGGGNVGPNDSTVTSALGACARSGCLREGMEVHCLVVKSGLERFEILGSSLLCFYASCLKIGEAERVFEELRGGNELLWGMPKKDVAAWSSLISGYVKREDGCERALELFGLMRESGEVVPNEFTFDSVVRACGKLGVLWVGMVIHGLSVKCGVDFDVFVSVALIEFYSDCQAVDFAKRVYEGMENPSLNASNAYIGRLVSMGRIEDAERVFDGVKEKDSVSYNLMIKGYAMRDQVNEAKRLFECMKHRTIVSSNTMISVYSRNGEIDKALQLFEETKGERDHVTWSAMMSGYIHNQQHEEALELYVTMCRLSIDRTRSTFAALFHACSCLGSLELGQVLHAQLIKTPFESNVYVGTSLIDMYSKCGCITDAETSFNSITSPNVAAWTALINGCAQHGLGSEAVLLFERMLKQGFIPNAATVFGVLSACNHSGLVNEGRRIYDLIEKSYGINPSLEHCACIVDLLGRSGRLQEAMDFIEEMTVEPDGVIWGAMLNACWLWMDTELAEQVAEKMCSLDPKPVSAYVILSNIYAVQGKFEEKINARNRLRKLKAKKDPGCSWIRLNFQVHQFSVQDTNHPHCTMIYKTLEHLTANMNSIVEFGSVYMPTVNSSSIYATYIL